VEDIMTYAEAKQRLDEWYARNDVNISPEILSCCYNAIQKQIPKKVVSNGDDESDNVYCPHCYNSIGSNENVWDEFYHRGWSPMHCQECGQSMIWK
jgi:hypothetical protein